MASSPLIDRKGFSGVSIAESAYDDSSLCLPDTKWAGKKGYLIKLTKFVKLTEPISREEFFNNPAVAEKLREIYDRYKGEIPLFYNKNFELNQPLYFTKAPRELIDIFNDIYKKKTDSELPYVGSSITQSPPITQTTPVYPPKFHRRDRIRS